MSFFQKWFGKKSTPTTESASLEEHLPYLHTLRQPAIRLCAAESAGFSKLGGMPNLPESFVWPEWKGKPHSFLCQLALADLPPDAMPTECPRTGYLFIFYDQDQNTWGFSPEDRGSWLAYYTTDDVRACLPHYIPAGLDNHAVFREQCLAFQPFMSYPDWQDNRVSALSLSDQQSDAYIERCGEPYGDAPAHQLFGYPAPIQNNDMEEECQLASHGVDCGGRVPASAEQIAELKPGIADWRLLLQLDTDDDAGMMWGDAGMLYFWMTQDDLAAARFENCWMVLQCY